MKKCFWGALALFLSLLLLLPASPGALGYEKGDAVELELDSWIADPARRSYVQMMVDYYIRTDDMIQSALKGGFAAMFLFDGCSDHMLDPALRDLTYYRVTGVCVVVKQDDTGALKMLYFNDNCTTLPDRPLDIGAWTLPGVGPVGPATIRDGTYQIYSVLHKGRYPALNVRTEYYDPLIDAVYMTADGFVPSRASQINVHTRTGNHTISRGMWSAGCPLVGAGKAWEFWKLMESVYYTSFSDFQIDTFVGTLTIDRQALRYEMYSLYGDTEAVDALLAFSQARQPEAYLELCRQETFSRRKRLRTLTQTSLMTLPCTNAADARSIEAAAAPGATELEALGRLTNPQGEKWYMVIWGDGLAYVPDELVRLELFS